MDEIPQWEIAKNAVYSYADLLPTCGTYSAGAMVSFIKLAHQMDESTQAECDAIERCVSKIVKDWNAIRVTVHRR